MKAKPWIHVLTLFRLIVPLAISHVIFHHQRIAPCATTVLLAVFVIWDIADGMAARSFRVEGLRRRVLDGLVDRTSIYIVMISFAKTSYIDWIIIIQLAIRDAIYLVAIAALKHRKNVVILPCRFMRFANALLALSAVMTVSHLPLAIDALRIAVDFQYQAVADYVVALLNLRPFGTLVTLRNRHLKGTIPGSEEPFPM